MSPSPSTALALCLLVTGPSTVRGFCEVSEDDSRRLEAGEIVVELRATEGTRVKEGCALGVIDASPEEVFEVVADAARFAEFMPHVVESTVEPESENVYLNTQKLDLPFPIANRHYTTRIHTSTPGEEGRTVWKVEWEYVPGSGNVEDTRGAWILRRWAEERTLLSYRLATDPGGLLPKWAVNRATRKTLPDVVTAVRRRLAERRGANEDTGK